MPSIIAEIEELQEQQGQTVSEHLAENDKYHEHCKHGNIMGQQISLDRKTELGLLEIELQRKIEEKMKQLPIG